MITNTVFSETEVLEIAIKLKDATKADINKCVGTWEEELEQKTIVKKCRGITSKSRTRGTGSGTVKASMHMPHDIFAGLYGMDQEGLKEGVTAYGQSSLHPVFCVTAKVLDEDGNIKYKAYPNCSIQTGISRKVENGAEEISEIELEFSVSPDEKGNGLYEAIESDLSDTDLKTKWMQEFTSELVEKTA